MSLAAFPDLVITVEDMITEGDKVACCVTIRGTHKGDLKGMAPTGKQITMTGIEIHRIAGGKFVEHREQMDMMGMLQ